MGLFEKMKTYREGRLQKRIVKNLRVLSNPKAIKEDRTAALEFFKSYDDPEVAVPALLKRFEFSLEHGINDSREKEVAMAGIIRHEQAALPIVQEHLSKTNRIAWPIKILSKIGSEEDVVEALLNALDYGDIAFDQAAVDKNYDVLCYLIDFKIEGLAEKVAHFLNDADERVRFAAVEVLVNQTDEGLPVLLERFLLDESAENRRIRATVIDAFVSNGWHVNNTKDYPEGPLVEGVFVTKKGKLERRF